MKDLTAKIRTIPQVKIALEEITIKKKEFTTIEIVEELLNRAGKGSTIVRISSNRIAKYLQAQNTHEFHTGLKKWIKIRQ